MLPNPVNFSDPGVRVLRAAWVADGAGRVFAPGAVVLRGAEVLAVGSPEAIGPVGGSAETVDLPAHGILPALVNPHAHLDLTAVRSVGDPLDFDAWLAGVRAARGSMDAGAVARSVKLGAQRSVAGGVAAIGDIAGQHAPDASFAACSDAGLVGCVFQEVFGMGPRLPLALEVVAEASLRQQGPAGQGLRRGLQPHAPYSSHRDVFEAALRSGLPVSTHLAETADERRFLRDGEGPYRRLLESLGLWEPGVVTGDAHPVDWMARRLSAAPATRILCAHLNDLDDRALGVLAALPVDVAYCPRASEYFGHAGHRYREMRAAGINVCLGTDSAICLDTPDRISTLDDVRLLVRRDGVALGEAIAMAASCGARALGLDAARWTLRPGPVAGVLAVPLGAHRGPQEFGRTNSAPEWLARS